MGLCRIVFLLSFFQFLHSQNFIAVSQACVSTQLIEEYWAIVADVLGVINKWELASDAFSIGYIIVGEIINEPVIQLHNLKCTCIKSRKPLWTKRGIFLVFIVYHISFSAKHSI